MSEQILMPIGENSRKALTSLEKAREAHEKYLVRQQNSDLQEAIEYYVDAVKLDPTIPESYYRLASLMWEQGQISINTAIEQCKTACSLEPKNMNAHLYTGFFMRLAQDYKSAEAEFKSAIRMSKLKSARPRLILSQSILQKINSKDGNIVDYANFLYYFISGSLMLAWDKPAIKMFYKNIADDFSVFKYNTLGKIYEKFKMISAAENVYKTAVEKIEHGEIFYNRMGDIAVRNNDYDLAVESYKKALDVNPLNRDIWAKLAIILQTYFPDMQNEAIDCYEKLLEFDENKAPIYYELGHLYMSKEDKINAISAFKLATELDMDNPFYNNSLAYAYSKAELYDDAIYHYQKAIELNPDNEWTSIVCQALGTLYVEASGNLDAAAATYQAGLLLDPKNYDLYLSLGDIFMAEYDLDKAIRVYCDAITLNPAEAKGYSKVGIALWEKEYLEEALVAYHKAVELDPENAHSRNNLGILYLEGLMDADEALGYFDEAININPSYTLAYFNAGRASEALGFTNDAAHYYQMAIDLNKLTNDMDENDIQERLHKLFEL